MHDICPSCLIIHDSVFEIIQKYTEMDGWMDGFLLHSFKYFLSTCNRSVLWAQNKLSSRRQTRKWLWFRKLSAGAGRELSDIVLSLAWLTLYPWRWRQMFLWNVRLSLK
jgi:hypothetical protein